MSGLEIVLSENPNSINLNSWDCEIIEGKLQINTYQPEKDMVGIISHITNQGVSIENVHIYRSSLEDVFMKLTGKSLKDDTIGTDVQETIIDV